MSHNIVIWLLVVAFFGAGLFNVVGTRATQDNFARWGYPRWWCRVTGSLEIVSAGLIILPASRLVGMTLGALIITAAIITVLRRQEFSHTVPLGVFAVLFVLAATTS
jgi:hypothetical protein